jgi:hypothetical protein
MTCAWIVLGVLWLLCVGSCGLYVFLESRSEEFPILGQRISCDSLNMLVGAAFVELVKFYISCVLS